MPRRAILITLVFCLAALAIAVAPWTVPPGAIPAAVAKQLRRAYGLDFTARGRHTVALLPVPRLKFEDVTISTPEGMPVVQGGQLRGEFKILPLFAGRLELSDVALTGGRVTLTGDGAGRTPIDLMADRLRRRAEARTSTAHIRRLALTGMQVQIRPPESETEIQLDDLNVVVNWASPDSAANANGSFVWRGEPVKFTLDEVKPGALVTGQPTRVSGSILTPASQLKLAAEIAAGEERRASGRVSFEVQSVPDLMRWSGVGVPLGLLMPPLTAEGNFTADRNGISCSAIRLTLGGDQLDGALSARLDGSRTSITGTLAAEQLDVTGFIAPLSQAWNSGPSWSSEPFNFGRLTSGDLDLRLSASSARAGSLELEDLGASVQVKPGRIEASLGRATTHRGTLKGRLSLAAAGPRTDMRLQGSFDRVDIGGLLADFGQPRWISGTGQGQMSLEGVGESPADLVRQLNGRMSILLKPGELIGVGLGDVLKRVERRPLSASLDWRGGRTSFDHAVLTMNVAGGIGDVLEGSLTSPLARASLQGRVSFVDRGVTLKANVEGTGTAAPLPGIAFDITGPWEDMAIVPDARALIQRSGAAQPLLGHVTGNGGVRGSSAVSTSQ